jgi:hypothetical protein
VVFIAIAFEFCPDNCYEAVPKHIAILTKTNFARVCWYAPSNSASSGTSIPITEGLSDRSGVPSLSRWTHRALASPTGAMSAAYKTVKIS